MIHRSAIAVVLGLLLTVVPAAALDPTGFRGDNVVLNTCFRFFAPPPNTCVFVEAGELLPFVPGQPHGSGSAAVRVTYLTYDPTSGDYHLVSYRDVLLDPDDLVVNHAATKATLQFPGASLVWTYTGDYFRETNFELVTRYKGVTTRSRHRTLEKEAFVQGVLDGVVLDTAVMPNTVPGINIIAREREITR